jgi:tripartite-type tricarboxylate transporter receptor subunit TctC
MKIIKVLALAFSMLVANGAFADTWPSRPIRFIVGLVPGVQMI